MRIIAGEAKGRKLYAPGGEDTRPTADRIRESVFGILGSRTQGARVLDLFGGTGALALEALSRGATGATIVDSNVKAVACIRRNAEAVLGGELARVDIIRADYRKAIGRLQAPCGLVFLDPPYHKGLVDWALSALAAADMLEAEGCIVAETAQDETIALPAAFCLADERKYGKSRLRFIGRA